MDHPEAGRPGGTGITALGLIAILAMTGQLRSSANGSMNNVPAAGVPVAAGMPGAGVPAAGVPVAGGMPGAGVPAAAMMSLDPNGLSRLLPTSVNGVAASRVDVHPASQDSPRVFLKVIARLGQTPPGARVALAFVSGATVYALQVDGKSGHDILQAYLEESAAGSTTASSFSAASVGGKQAMRVGTFAGTFMYAGRETFFYLECPDEATASAVLKQLP